MNPMVQHILRRFVTVKAVRTPGFIFIMRRVHFAIIARINANARTSF
jgi:hypothetical protein